MSAGIVIIGGGECGAYAALALRDNGYDGSVILIGEEPHLPYERPPLSKSVMSGEDEPSAKTIATHERFADAGIMVMASVKAVAIHRDAKTVELSNGETVVYDRLLLATGASPRRLALAQAAGRCVYLRTFDDAMAIRGLLLGRPRVAIIGGGFIGLELAAAARALDCVVTVIETQSRLLARVVPQPIADIVQARHQQEGVRILCGARIIGVEQTADAARIMIDIESGAGPVDPAQLHAVDADMIVIGIGATPNTMLAETAGLAIENGIAVDSYLRTADPQIFAAGDCCSFPLNLYGGRRVRLEAWRNAQEQGSLAARNMLGAGERHISVPWFWSDQYDLGLQIAGLPDEGEWTVRRELDGGAIILFHIAADGRLVAASGIGPGNAVARDIRLAEMLIAQRARPDPDKLAAREFKLKALLSSNKSRA